jgi:hypothetical protein
MLKRFDENDCIISIQGYQECFTSITDFSQQTHFLSFFNRIYNGSVARRKIMGDRGSPCLTPYSARFFFQAPHLGDMMMMKYNKGLPSNFSTSVQIQDKT